MKLPEVIDLFSGCGGLALGFERAGFRITHGIELSASAVKNISYNMSWRYGQESGHVCKDITLLDPEVFASEIGPEGCIVIGGPPCQAYSLAGRAKLRSLGENRVNTNDSRGYLYQDFLRFALGLNAKAVIMENVPESVDYGGKNIPQTVCDSLEANGYHAKWSVLNSANYGVPQIRERIFVIAVRKDIAGSLHYPDPTHKAPGNFTTANDARMKGFSRFSNFVIPAKPSEDLPDWITVGDAFSDLPTLFPSYDSRYVSRKLNTQLPYALPPKNAFQRLMREWYGSDLGKVTANYFRNNQRDFPIFAMMAQGANYLDASNLADSLLNKRIEISSLQTADEDITERLRSEMVPCYDRSKFESKWKRLSWDKPSHTLVAHLANDTYSHIHPVEPRGISVREAARLQSIPDDYFFNCNNGDAFRQIGNAVPVLLAYAVAEQVRRELET